MNERIQELAQQAFINAGYDTKDELFDILFKQGAEFHEKFAELIVRECEKSIKSVPTHFEAQDKIIVECLKSIRETFRS